MSNKRARRESAADLCLPIQALLEDDKLLHQMKSEAVSYAGTHGIVMQTNEANAHIVHAPLSLVPSKIPRKAFEHVRSLQTKFNLLVDVVSRDTNFIKETLNNVISGDEFTKQLMSIFETVTSEGISQETYLGIHRSDYMLHSDTSSFLQVELNTISVSFQGIGSMISAMHRHLASRYLPEQFREQNYPPNKAAVNIAASLAEAANIVHSAEKNHSPVVLMLVQPGETNSADQKFLEYYLWENHKIPVIRKSLQEVHDHGVYDKETKELIIDGNHVSVAYYRAGYTPRDYPSSKEWEARLLIERARCIKCPSIAYHLVGTKKIQQVLALPGVLERFCSPEDATSLRTCFAGLWSLDAAEQKDSDLSKIIESARQSPEGFVLKPQREGGGNNLYGKEMVHALETYSSEKLSAHILMSRINPPLNKGILIKNGEISISDTVSELGIYGTFIGDGSVTSLNNQVGHLLRTKAEGVDEGGIAAGFAVLDSPFVEDS